MNDLLDTVCFVCRGRNNGITAQGTWREHAVSARHAEVCVGSDIWESHIKISAKTCIVAAHTAVRAHTYTHTHTDRWEGLGSREADDSQTYSGRADGMWTDRETDSTWTD